MKKIFRIILIGFSFFIGTIVIFFLIALQPLDRTSYKDQPHYKDMMHTLDSLSGIQAPKALAGFRTGFAKENLTPSFRVATAGYGNRRGKKITAVHDSVFVRAIVISNGSDSVAIVSADLLIIPPEVTEILDTKLEGTGFSLGNTYLNATHTHNSIGNWAKGATGLIYGSYRDSIVTFIADKIVESIRKASVDLRPSVIKTGTIAVPSAIRNRLDKTTGTVDSLLHIIEVQREDSTRIVMLSFNAHATCLYSKDLELSRDYPGVLVDNLEASGYDFAMFLSGAVGSHGCNPPEFGKPCLGWMADEIEGKFDEAKDLLGHVRDSTLMMIRVPLQLGEPQVKISENWRMRPWLFKSAFGEYQPYLTVFRLGNIVLLGTPCDFSGELTGEIRAAGAKHGLNTIVTSFNGHYIGYITVDKYYDYPHYETRLMNWYGPGNGAYFTECLIKLVEAVN